MVNTTVHTPSGADKYWSAVVVHTLQLEGTQWLDRVHTLSGRNKKCLCIIMWKYKISRDIIKGMGYLCSATQSSVFLDVGALFNECCAAVAVANSSWLLIWPRADLQTWVQIVFDIFQLSSVCLSLHLSDRWTECALLGLFSW